MAGCHWNCSVVVDNVHSFFQDNVQLLTKVALAVTIGVTLHHGVKYLQSRALQKRRAAYKKDVVILHQFGRAYSVPNISPYCLKLETYLRLAKIPYENDFKDCLGPMGKAPWITYNGEDVADSRLCIEWLNKKFKVDLNSHLTAQEKAVGHAFVMATENGTGWFFAIHRWVYEDAKFVARLMNFSQFTYGLPFKWVHSMISKRMDKASRAMGVGRHSRETIYKFAKEDLKQLSAYLGQKKFFFGDKISEFDCSLFSWMAMCVWASPGSKFEDWVHGDFENLKDYCLRVKEECWPDWESCLDTSRNE